MFKKLYKAANNEIKADDKLLEKILNNNPPVKKRIKIPPIAAAACFLILIFAVAYPETNVQFSADTDYSGNITTRTSKLDKKASATGTAKEEAAADNYVFNMVYDLNICSEDLSEKQQKADFNHSLPEGFTNKKSESGNFIYTNSDDTKKIIFGTNILPVMISADNIPAVINDKKVYLFKSANNFYAEYSDKNSLFNNIWAENLTEEEFIYIIENNI